MNPLPSNQVKLVKFLSKSSFTLTFTLFPKHATLKCLNIGTPKTINFPFGTNGKLMIFRCSNI